MAEVLPVSDAEFGLLKGSVGYSGAGKFLEDAQRSEREEAFDASAAQGLT